MARSWREIAREVILRAMEQAREQGMTGAEMLRYVDDAYPFGERRYHPYKMWCEERRALCLGRPKVRPSRVEKAKPENADERALMVAQGQMEMEI